MIDYQPYIQPVSHRGHSFGLLRLDRLHASVSGNKWFKLRLNLEAARAQHKNHILTFGGAHSNHLLACAAACRELGFAFTALVRGEANEQESPTLLNIRAMGAEIRALDREEYRQKTEPGFLEALVRQYAGSYIIPEGGDNELGIRGCEAILTEETAMYQTICCAVGTGTTFRGLERALRPGQQLVGFPVLKGFAAYQTANASYCNAYHFGGYARHTDALLDFKNEFETSQKIPLDYVYTAKLLYGVCELMEKNMLRGPVLAIHSGGLQGNAAYEARYNLNPSRQLIDPQG